ncbi:MAG TPA: universal stress protein [Longimicrobiales bacterium]|nr:universal stress protein [Longimicrobiales bacterium]
MPFRITSIIVATDLSDSAHQVLRTAAELAALTEADLHVVHAAEFDDDEERSMQAARDALREQVRGVITDAVVASYHVASGRSHEVVLERAAQVGADLIVIGPHRERPLGDRVLGSTADRLVRTSSVPCLIVHAPFALPLGCMLVPTGLGEFAWGALDEALIWGAALRHPTRSGEHTRLVVMHVLPPAAEDGPVVGERVHAEHQLEQQVAAAQDRMGGVVPLRVTQLVVRGRETADENLLTAREHCADLIVLGTHGHSGLARALIGSVSSAVARRAECPVLLVPPALSKARQELEGALAQPTA